VAVPRLSVFLGAVLLLAGCSTKETPVEKWHQDGGWDLDLDRAGGKFVIHGSGGAEGSHLDCKGTFTDAAGTLTLTGKWDDNRELKGTAVMKGDHLELTVDGNKREFHKH
jgi:hypothetical protein